MENLRTNKLIFLSVVIVCLSFARTQAKDTGAFVITSPKSTAELVFNKNEKLVVYTAVGLFSDDVYAITGRQLNIPESSKSKNQIKIGTIGVDSAFDQECKEAGIDVNVLSIKWEAYTIKMVSKSGRNSLWIVGSDPRGTAFGIMELSRLIGVSPWCWWADVKPKTRETVSLPGNLSLEDAPKVKFRGIFLNDEDWGLQPWAARTFEPETGDIGPKTYEKIFELLLRMKANAVWPAMHDCTRAFFTYPGNIEMADKYGIWVGSSHCEPMLRNNVDEWHRWEPSSGKRGAWNFDENPEQITEYWKQRVEATTNHDGIYTVGMRGIHDGSMPGGKNVGDKVQILGQVLDTQRNLLENITGKPVTGIPQIFCPYKEVLQLYKAGATIPDDVTIMWADDNHGYIRQLSNTEERKRSGGAGVYYHISYWGRPHDFLWIESIPVSLIWEEMHKAYQTNAKNVWIVNVGDIKPNEIGMNFFLDMAWNPEQFYPEALDSYYTKFAESQFGEKYGVEIGEILSKYFQLGFSRKPEHMGWNGVYPNTPVQDPELSLFINGDEAQQRIDAYDSLEQQVGKLYKDLPDNLKDAFYELVGYKVIGASNMNKKILYAYKSREYAREGRNSANVYAQKAEAAFEKIKQATAFYNDSLAGGKWKHMMTYNPRGMQVFDMPQTGSFHSVQKSGGGILPEEYSAESQGEEVFTLPVFNSITDRSYFVDVFNSGTAPLQWETKTTDDWVAVSKRAGNTETQDRIWLSVDWDKISSNDTIRTDVLFKLNGRDYRIGVVAIKPDWTIPGSPCFVEDNGIVSMEAENFSAQNKTEAGSWALIESLGRSSDAMGAFPVTAPPFSLNDLAQAPSLLYNFYLESTGQATLRFYCLPALPLNDEYQLRMAVSIDDSEPFVVNAALKEEMDEDNPEWKNNVLRAAAIPEIKTLIREKGKHTLKITMIDPGVVLDKIEITTGEKKRGYLGAPETNIRKP
ncbi:MAG: glycosyl hydrolase 115 family protein [Mangrovibacterium sp.]